ncbi:MAG: methylmalonyl-CoA mutase family protein [Hyphomicrobiales bacterium]
MTRISLAEEFEPPQREDWMALVGQVLKGADFEKKLVWLSHDGLRVEPLYTQTTHLQMPGRRAHGWQALQRVDIPSLEDANGQALRDLENGAAGLTIVTGASAAAHGFGVNAHTADHFQRLLQGVHLEMIPLRLDGGWNSDSCAAAVLKVYKDRGLDAGKTNLTLGLDPLGGFAQTGQMDAPDDLPGQLGEILGPYLGGGFGGCALLADCRLYHNAGASEAQELAFALATAVTYLRWLDAAGIDPEKSNKMVGMLLSVDADMFMSAAKLRAARLLWARVQEVMELEPEPLKLHTETSWRMMTRRDPHVNLLRTTAATFAAGIAGADSLTVLPFTGTLGLPDSFARRMARNTQTIFLEETHLGHVQDPGAGSGFMDQTALDLAAISWKLFQEIEADGGMVITLASGAVQKHIASVHDQRLRNIATRKEPITGVSEFPNLSELPVAVLDCPASAANHPDADGGISCAPLNQARLSEDYEALRDASDAVLDKHGSRPSVFMANIGRVADFTARATWAGNIFEAGGIEAPRNDGFNETDKLAEAFKKSGAKIAVLCSSDEIYHELGTAAIEALLSAGTSHVYVAGKHSDTLEKAGAGTFIHIGCDILSILRNAHEILGIAR